MDDSHPEAPTHQELSLGLTSPTCVLCGVVRCPQSQSHLDSALPPAQLTGMEGAVQGEAREGTEHGRRSRSLSDNPRPVLVRGCAHVCVKHSSAMWSWFGLHGRGRFLLSHLDGKRKHFQRSRDAKAGSFTLFTDPLAPSQKEALAAGACLNPILFPLSLWLPAIPSLSASSLGPFKAFPDRAGSGSLSQLWQSMAGLSPAIQSFLLSQTGRAPTPLP